MVPLEENESRTCGLAWLGTSFFFYLASQGFL